jgi:hypothetical protein
VNTIDELMDRDPDELTVKDYDAIIAYIRETRSKGPIQKEEAPKLKLDLVALGLVKKAPPREVFKRRV